MGRIEIVLSVVMMLNLVGFCRGADGDHNDIPADSIWDKETLTDGFWGLSDELAENDIEVGLGFTNIYQQNLRGTLSKHRRTGHFQQLSRYHLYR